MAFTVRDFHDLIELLEKEPAWRADVRRLVLTEEILSLPQVMRELAQSVQKLSESVDVRFTRVDTKIQNLSESVDARFDTVDTKIQNLSESVDARFDTVDTKIQNLSESVDARFDQVDARFDQVDARFDQVDARFSQVDARFSQVDARFDQVDARFNQVDRDIHLLKTDVGDLKGSNLESMVRERPFVYLGRFALRLKAVSDAELAILLEDAIERGLITEEEAEDAKLLDAIARGRRRGDASPLYLAVEVSSVVDQHDLVRAVRRAAIVEKASSVPTQPIVVGKQVLDDVRQTTEGSGADWVTLP